MDHIESTFKFSAFYTLVASKNYTKEVISCLLLKCHVYEIFKFNEFHINFNFVQVPGSNLICFIFMN